MLSGLHSTLLGVMSLKNVRFCVLNCSTIYSLRCGGVRVLFKYGILCLMLGEDYMFGEFIYVWSILSFVSTWGNFLFFWVFILK